MGRIGSFSDFPRSFYLSFAVNFISRDVIDPASHRFSHSSRSSSYSTIEEARTSSHRKCPVRFYQIFRVTCCIVAEPFELRYPIQQRLPITLINARGIRTAIDRSLSRIFRNSANCTDLEPSVFRRRRISKRWDAACVVVRAFKYDALGFRTFLFNYLTISSESKSNLTVR